MANPLFAGLGAGLSSLGQMLAERATRQQQLDQQAFQNQQALANQKRQDAYLMMQRQAQEEAARRLAAAQEDAATARRFAQTNTGIDATPLGKQITPDVEQAAREMGLLGKLEIAPAKGPTPGAPMALGGMTLPGQSFSALGTPRSVTRTPNASEQENLLRQKNIEAAEASGALPPGTASLLAIPGAASLYSATHRADEPTAQEASLARFAKSLGLNSPEDLSFEQEQQYRQQVAGANRTPQSTSLTPTSEAALIGRLSKQWTDAASPTVELDRQLNIMNAGLKAAERGDLTQGAQAVLVTFQKVLDPPSVVRESEYMRSAAGLALMERVRGWKEQLLQGGAGVPYSELVKFGRLAQEAAEAQRSGYLNGVKNRLEKTAERYSIPNELWFTPLGPTAGPATTPTIDFTIE